jgi:hypothetical protein
MENGIILWEHARNVEENIITLRSDSLAPPERGEEGENSKIAKVKRHKCRVVS